MSDDRLAQARAEAGRAMSRMPFGQARIGYEAGHEHGVEWADANPQPHTITRGGYEHAKRMFGISPAETRQFLRALGIEAEDDDE